MTQREKWAPLGYLTKLPEGREVLVCLMDEDLARIRLTGGKDSIDMTVSLDQVLAIVKSVERLLEKKNEVTKQGQTMVEGGG